MKILVFRGVFIIKFALVLFVSIDDFEQANTNWVAPQLTQTFLQNLTQKFLSSNVAVHDLVTRAWIYSEIITLK